MDNETNNEIIINSKLNDKRRSAFPWFPTGIQLILTLTAVLMLFACKHLLPEKFEEVKAQYRAYMFDSIYGQIDEEARGYTEIE